MSATNGNGIKKKRKRQMTGNFRQRGEYFLILNRKGWWTTVFIGRTGHRVDNGNLAEVLLMTNFSPILYSFCIKSPEAERFVICLDVREVWRWTRRLMGTMAGGLGLFVMFQSDGCLKKTVYISDSAHPTFSIYYRHYRTQSVIP